MTECLWNGSKHPLGSAVFKKAEWDVLLSGCFQLIYFSFKAGDSVQVASEVK